MYRLGVVLCLCVVILQGLIGCNKPASDVLRVGTITGPETSLVMVAKEVALKKYGLKVKVIEFNDYNLPNEALQDGSLDANIYQHLPYLQDFIKAKGYALISIGKSFVYPTGIYAFKIKNLAQLPEKAVIAIPNDPSNEARALLLLQAAGLISLKSMQNVSLADINKNPKQLRFKELDAAQLPRVLQDVDAAVINTSFAIPAGLHPSRDAIFLEAKNSPYANIVVVCNNTTKQAELKSFVKALNSQEVKTKAAQIFGDAAIPAW